MSIRPATPADVPAIRQCARAAYAMYVSRIGREPAPMVADFAARVAEGVVWVETATSDGPVRGFIVAFAHRDAWHIENVAVSPDHQGAGVGGRLMRFAEELAVKAGFDRVELYTNAKMTENQSLYPALGYEEFDRRSEDGFDRIYYRKALARDQ